MNRETVGIYFANYSGDSNTIISRVDYLLEELGLNFNCIRYLDQNSTAGEMVVSIDNNDKIVDDGPFSQKVYHIHTYNMHVGLHAAWILLNIIKVLLANNKNPRQLIAASVVLTNILTDQGPRFVPQSMQRKLAPIPEIKLVNNSKLYVAGRYLDFREEFTLTNTCEPANDRVEIKFDLKRYHFLKIDKLSFHMHNQACAVFDYKFLVEYEDGSVEELKEYHLSNVFNAGGVQYALHAAPMCFSHIRRINPRYFICSFSILGIEKTKFFKKMHSVEQIINHYKGLERQGKLKTKFFNPESDRLLSHHNAAKKVTVFLGPKQVGLERLNNFLLDHAGDLSKKKFIYPTHQREFFNKSGQGSLYSTFTRHAGNNIIYDERKAAFLKNDLLKTNFKTMILGSEAFLDANRLFYCNEVFGDLATYVYYLCDNLELAFEQYKNQVYFNKYVHSFKAYLEQVGCAQVKYFFSLLTTIAPEQLVLRMFTPEYDNDPKLFINLALDLIGCKIDVTDHNIKYPFNLRNISCVALECRRLLNFYTFLDEEIAKFIQISLLEYPKEDGHEIFLDEDTYKNYSAFYKKELELLFSIYNYKQGLEALNSVTTRVDQYISQNINAAQVADVFKFLQDKDDDMYTRLLIELKLSKNITTDNAEFNSFVEAL